MQQLYKKTPLCSGVSYGGESIHAGKHDADQAYSGPAEHGVDCDRDQIMQFEHRAIHIKDPDQALEYVQEGLRSLINQFSKGIGGVGSHELEHEARADQAVEQTDAQKD